MSDRYEESVTRVRERADSHRATNIEAGAQVIQIKDADFFGSKTRGAKDQPVIPNADEKVISYRSQEGKRYVDQISHINLNLTNACNLSCSYCYEQHRKDYGTWDLDKINKVYDFLNEVSDLPHTRTMQFFGGEPLIHRKLILEYLREYKDKLSNNRENIKISIVSNGLLLDEKFIEEYFAYNFTGFLLSLDTFNTEVDHREITPKQMERIRKSIKHIVEVGRRHNHHNAISIRCTLSRETAPSFREFLDELHEMGVKDMVVHPLTMSNYHGYIEWSDEEWDKLQEDLIYAIRQLGMVITFSEGVAQKGSTANCLIGNNMISIDGSGDFSGCYFFTNLKDLTEPFILGNMFDDKMYIDRYAHFQKIYDESFTVHEKCQTCNLQNYCYQCPAGNADTGSKALFRPDSMCQKIVQMFLDIRKESGQAAFQRRFDMILQSFVAEPENIEKMESKALQILAYRHTNKRWPEEALPINETMPVETAGSMLYHGYNIVGKPYGIEALCEHFKPNSTKTLPDVINANPLVRRAFLLTILHFVD